MDLEFCMHTYLCKWVFQHAVCTHWAPADQVIHIAPKSKKKNYSSRYIEWTQHQKKLIFHILWSYITLIIVRSHAKNSTKLLLLLSKFYCHYLSSTEFVFLLGFGVIGIETVLGMQMRLVTAARTNEIGSLPFLRSAAPGAIAILLGVHHQMGERCVIMLQETGWSTGYRLL